MRTTDKKRSVVLTIFWGCIMRALFPNSALFLSFISCICRVRSRSAAVMTQLLDSTLAIVSIPRRIGNVIVGSGWASVESVAKDSESKGVGSTDSRPKAIVVITKTGN